MNRKIQLIVLVFTFMSVSLLGQKTNTTPPSSYGYMTEPVYVPSLAQQMKDGTLSMRGRPVRITGRRME